MERLRSFPKVGLPILLAMLSLAPPCLRADDTIHEGDDSGAVLQLPSLLDGDPGDEESPRGVRAPVVLGVPESGPNLRDSSGKLLPPPNFLTASGAFSKTIYEARNPTPVPVMVSSKTQAPEVDIANLPTYSGNAPNPKVGFVGGDLRPPEPAHVSDRAVVEARAAKQQKDAIGIDGQIQSAARGKVASQPIDPSVLEAQEKLRQKKEAERIARIGRMPASFAKPKLGAATNP